ncbi:LysR substrate-binding domain-containing protein [Roseovarius aestuarii]|nr:LysR substrate-binding domain-containing protein [Roseovarius aestuarii]
MSNIRARLPHLDPLVAFEAAARLGSFKHAADELCVTASAVSQQIRALESQMNVALFERGHRSVWLTDRGKDFHNSVVVALNHLANAADEARLNDGKERLKIATDTSFAAHWFIPRLPKFEALHPDISLHIMVTDVRNDLLNGDCQVAMVHGEGDWRGYVTEQLFGEEVFPVCSPDYLEKWNGTITPNDLVNADLLDLDYEKWNWMNWAIWLTEMNISMPNLPRKLRMNSYPLLVDAAKRGAGIALAWRYLVDDDLVNGSLIRPLDHSVKTKYGYHIASPFNDKRSHATDCFVEWLLSERNLQRACI